MRTWYVFYGGSYLGQIKAKTAAAALRKARFEWGSSGEWTDADLKKFTVKAANPSKLARSLTLRNMALVTIRKNRDGSIAVSGRKMASRSKKR